MEKTKVKQIINTIIIRECIKNKFNCLGEDIDLHSYIMTMIENNSNETIFEYNGDRYQLTYKINTVKNDITTVKSSVGNDIGYAVDIRLVGLDNSIKNMFVAMFNAELNCVHFFIKDFDDSSNSVHCEE